MNSKLYLAKSYSPKFPNKSSQKSNSAQNRTSHKQKLFIPQEVFFFLMRCQVACVSHQWKCALFGENVDGERWMQMPSHPGIFASLV
jgi:hypothetical protein